MELIVLKMNPTRRKLRHFLSNFMVDLENGVTYKKKYTRRDKDTLESIMVNGCKSVLWFQQLFEKQSSSPF